MNALQLEEWWFGDASARTLWVFEPPPAEQLVMTVDALVAGVHFPQQTAARAIGHKALAVNLSDLAAMGARPRWVTLVLSLLDSREDWLRGFRAGFEELAARFQVELVALQAVPGPLAMTVQAYGTVPPGQALLRSGARPGDRIYVTGSPGDAAAGLHLYNQAMTTGAEADYLKGRLDYPEPRVDIGMALRGVASAAIDVSDGLVADLGHILDASGVGARLELARLPLSPALRSSFAPEQAWRWALGGGDDYELCFTVSPDKESALHQVLHNTSCPYTFIGLIEQERGCRIVSIEGGDFPLVDAGFDHFR